MKVTCILKNLGNRRWQAAHSGSSFGNVKVFGSSRDEALTKMRDELQYRIELCPCSGVSGDTVEVQVSEDDS